MKYKILSTWASLPFPDVMDPLKSVGELQVIPEDQKQLVETIGEYDVFLTSLKTRVDREVLDRAGNLKIIVTPSTGLDHIDVDEAEKRGITVLGIKNDYDFLKTVTATAEMAWCLLLAVVRQLPTAFDAAKQGFWARDTFRGHQMAYKTLGILGYGRLGEMMADYGKAFRMKVIACDLKEFQADGVRKVDFGTLLEESDVVTIHIHLTKENRGLIGEKELAKMKSGSVLINTSRGAIIDEDALLNALENGPMAGAGLDVICGEWEPHLYNHPLVRYARSHDNLVISPHLGGVTFESQKMAYDFVVKKILAYLKEQNP
jgi:D-3-phosphoglycerate dehydrogenase